MEQSRGLVKPSRMESSGEETLEQDLSARQSHELHRSRLTTKASSYSGWDEDLLAGFAAYCLTNLPVLLGVLFGAEFVRSANGQDTDPRPDLITTCIHRDAVTYVEIIQQGYSYSPARASSVAFFPAYPILGRWLSQATGLPAAEAALLVTHTALLGAFVLLARYVRVRWPEATAEQRGLVLAIFGLWPMGLFFRMPYTESLFVCSTLGVLYGMARNWPLVALAMLTGFVTAVRPVGVAVSSALLWHILTRSGLSPRAKVSRLLLLTPLSCWGLLAYMAYQWLSFGNPWAFAQTQEHWNVLPPEARTYPAKFWSLATLEPIWGLFIPCNHRYWQNMAAEREPIFCLLLWNPILFLLALGLLLLGGWKQWLIGSEMVLGLCLMAIPYLTRSCEMSMASHGRFAAVVVVNYLVIGRIMCRAPRPIIVGIHSAYVLWLFIFASLYVMNYSVF